MSSPTDDVIQFLEAVASRLGLLKQGGAFDIHQAAIKVIRMYNDGFFGAFCLDDLQQPTNQPIN